MLVQVYCKECLKYDCGTCVTTTCHALTHLIVSRVHWACQQAIIQSTTWSVPLYKVLVNSVLHCVRHPFQFWLENTTLIWHSYYNHPIRSSVRMKDCYVLYSWITFIMTAWGVIHPFLSLQDWRPCPGDTTLSAQDYQSRRNHFIPAFLAVKHFILVSTFHTIFRLENHVALPIGLRCVRAFDWSPNLKL